MAAIEELWEATYLPATLLNFQEPQDALYSPDGPDNDSSLSEEDYVEMFTEIPSSEDFLDIDVLEEETEENSQEGVEITYVYEQDMVNALNSALNSALANYNFIQDTDNLFPYAYSSNICTSDITNSWESWIEDVADDEEVSQLESEIKCLEEELAALKHEQCLVQTTAPQYLYSCLYSPRQESPIPSPIKRKIEEIEEEYESEEEISIEEHDEEEEEDSSSSDDDSDSSSSDSEEDSEDSSDSDSSSSSSDESSEDESEEEEEEEKTIYIPYKKRKVPISIFRQNRIKLIKTEEQDCEEDVDILN